MHIISWNVAGWTTTLEKIKSNHSNLLKFLQDHNVDILCIQEVKISSSELSAKPKDYGAINDYYDTFWSCPFQNTATNTSTTKSTTQHKQQRSGLNGVATFVKKGLIIKASSKILDNITLDCEGRCLLTDHNQFVIFNIYVPNSGQGHKRYPYKMTFLTALENAIKKQQLLGKYIVIVGDFNIAPRSIDVCRPFRQVNILRILYNELHSELGRVDFATGPSHTSTNITQESDVYTNSNFDNIVDTSTVLIKRKYDDITTTTTDPTTTPLPRIYAHSRRRYLTLPETRILLQAIYYIRAQWPDIESSLPSVQYEKEGNKYKAMCIRSYDGKKVSITCTLYIL